MTQNLTSLTFEVSNISQSSHKFKIYILTKVDAYIEVTYQTSNCFTLFINTHTKLSRMLKNYIHSVISIPHGVRAT